MEQGTLSSASPPPPTEQGSAQPTETPLGALARWKLWAISIKKELCQPAIVLVLVIVLAFNALMRIDAVQRTFPFIQAGQFWFHRVLCWVSPRLVTPKWVRVVEIDQQEHTKLGEPTDRSFLGKAISRAVAGDAAVVVLDVKLLAPANMSSGQDYENLLASDAALLNAVQDAGHKGVPVVLTTWLRKNERGDFQRLPNIFKDNDLQLPDKDGKCTLLEPDASTLVAGEGPYRRPACIRIGNINVPSDLRQAPLVTRTEDPSAPSQSVALAAVSAYEDAIQREPRTVSKNRIAGAIDDDDFVFASLIPESAFQKISLEDLAAGVKSALEDCRGRIVIIGGTWRADAGRGELVDSYNTPVGSMRGMYLIANYIEALLDDRYQREVPLLVALGIDLIVGAWLYHSFHKAKTRLARAKVLIIPAFLLLVCYVVFTNLNFYLDFILPLGACFVHLWIEYVRDYGRMRQAEIASRTSAA